MDSAANDLDTIQLSAQNVQLRDSDDIDLGTSSLSGNLTVFANNGISTSGNVTATGAVVLDADFDNNGSGIFDHNTTLSTSADVTITAAQMAIDGTINSGTGTITLLNSVVGGGFDLGSAGSGVGNTVELADSELDQLVAAEVIIGSSGTGDITLSADIALAQSDTLSLVTGADISQNNGTSLQETTLNLNAGGDAILTQASNDVSHLNVTATNSSFVDSNDLVVGDSTVSTMLVTTGGALSQNGSLQVANLGVQAGGEVLLTDSGNALENLAILAPNQRIQVAESDGGFTIGTVGGISGITGGALTLNIFGLSTMMPGGLVSGLIDVSSLDIFVNGMNLNGSIGGYTDEDALNLINLLGLGSGPYEFNGMELLPTEREFAYVPSLLGQDFFAPPMTSKSITSRPVRQRVNYGQGAFYSDLGKASFLTNAFVPVQQLLNQEQGVEDL